MDYKYKRAREELGISLDQLVGWINEELAEVGQTISRSGLFRIEEGIREKYDIKTIVATKWYKMIFSRWEREQKVKEINERYGG